MLADLLARLAAPTACRSAAPSPARPARPGRWPGAARTAPSSPPDAEAGAAGAAADHRPCGWSPRRAAQLVRLGLARIGQLAALPRRQLGRRFGPAALTRLDQALARAEEALSFRRPPTPWFARLAFAEPISAPEDLARVSRDIAGHALRAPAGRRAGAGRFELAFHRLDGRAERLVDRPFAAGPRARGASPACSRRCWRPSIRASAIEVVTLAADGGRGPARTPDRGCESDRRDRAGGRHRAAGRPPRQPPGRGRVWRAERLPQPHPRARRGPPRAARAGRAGRPRRWAKDRPRPVRLFRRPEPIEAMAPIPDDPPVFFRWRGQLRRVRRAEGPERLAEEWWRRPPARPAPPTCATTTASRTTPAPATGSSAPASTAARAPKWWLHGLG